MFNRHSYGPISPRDFPHRFSALGLNLNLTNDHNLLRFIFAFVWMK